MKRAAAEPDVLFEIIDPTIIEIRAAARFRLADRVSVDKLKDLIARCRANRWSLALPPAPVMRLLFPAPAAVSATPGRLPPKMIAALKEYQREAITDFSRKFGGRVLLADDPGLGKSIQSLGMVSTVGASRVLIVSPTTLCDNWCNEIAKWTDDTSAVIRTPAAVEKARREAHKYWIVTYDAIGTPARKLFEQICRTEKFDAVIADEAHRLKNYGAKRTQNLALDTDSPLQRAPYLVLLSGTPFTSRPIELFPLTQLVRRNEISKSEFARRYCDAKFVAAFGKVDDTGKSNQNELEFYVRKLMIRRRACDLSTVDLPKKTRRIERVPFPSLMKKLQYYQLEVEYYEALRKLKETTAAARGESRAAKFAKLEVQRLKSALLRFAGDAKKERALELFLVEMERLAPDEKALVFAHHEIVRSYVTAGLRAKGYETIEIDGSTKQSDRQARIASVADPASSVRVGVLSTSAAGEGLNATPGVVLSAIFELPWNPSSLNQAEARAHRIGATRPQRVAYYVLEGDTVESSVMRKHAQKNETTSFILNGKQNDEREFESDSGSESEEEED